MKTESSFFDVNIVKRKSIQKSAATVSTDLADERCPSGVEGLDDILAGGLPRDCFYLVQGDPGSGKTTLALQFLLEGYGEARRSFTSRFQRPKRNCSKWRDHMAGRSTKSRCWICPPSKICCGPKRKRPCFIHPKSSWPKSASYCSMKFARRSRHGSPSIRFPNSD